MERGWLKARIVVTKDDIDEPKLPRDSGIPNDTHVIAVVVNSTFPFDVSSEWAWQRCVSTATLISIDMARSCHLPIPSSPLESSSGSLSITTDLSIYLSETIRLQYHFKNREVVWIQPIKSHPVQEVWLRATRESTEKIIQQFLDQVEERSTSSRIIVKMNDMFRFNLNTSSHDPASKHESWFDVLQVLPIAQGHLTKDTKIIIVPASHDAQPCPPHSDEESDSDEGLTYDPQGRIIKDYSGSEGSDSDEETSIVGSHEPQPRKPLKSASEFRRSSVVTIGNNLHLFKCVPLYNFPVEKNFILLPQSVRERIGCYGLENLIISPVEYSGHHGDEAISLIAIVEDYKERSSQRSVVYVHPEVYFNLFPYPMDHMNTCHKIQVEV